MIHQILDRDRLIQIGAIASGSKAVFFLRCGDEFQVCTSLARALLFCQNSMSGVPLSELRQAILEPATTEEVRQLIPEIFNI